MRTKGHLEDIPIRQPIAVGRSECHSEWLACIAEGGCYAYRPGDFTFGYGKDRSSSCRGTTRRAIVDWLSRKAGAPYRLLSEAEWEYAARGCVSLSCPATAFWFGDDITPDQANYNWNISYRGSRKALPLRHTVDIEKSEPNPFGLLHVHGNVREWVEDCWNSSLAGLPPEGAARSSGDCTRRLVRGGSWADDPRDLRSAKRSWAESDERQPEIGFRVARSLIRQARNLREIRAEHMNPACRPGATPAL